MSAIQYLEGDATLPQGDGPKIIAHICNDIGGWGKGFVKAISRRWKTPEKAYRNWYAKGKKENFCLGSIQLVQVDDDLYVANMIAQRDIRRRNNDTPLRYDALETCLTKLTLEAQKLQASVHMPRIGCGLAGGKWNKVEPILQQTLSQAGIEITVYDFR